MMCRDAMRPGPFFYGVRAMAIDRSEVSRSLAKALAFKQCGKQAEAEAWAKRLVEQLECADILRD